MVGTVQVPNAKWTPSVLISGLSLTLALGVTSGYVAGIINNPAVFMRDWCREVFAKRYNVQISDGGLDLLWSSIVSICLVGGAVGAMPGSAIANRCGRRAGCLLSGIIFVLSGICFACCRVANSVELLLIGRFIAGLAAGLATAILPMYLSEITTTAQRGTLAVCYPVGITAGVVIAQLISLQGVLGGAEHWQWALSFQMVFVLLGYVPFKYFAESPKWLYVVQDRREDAAKELERLRGPIANDLIEAELETMRLEAQQNNNTMGYCQVFGDKRLRLPLILTCCFTFGQALSGINAIFFYSVAIFNTAGLTQTDAEWASLGAGFFNLAISLFSPWLMARFDRRPLLLLSIGACALSQLIISIVLYFVDAVSWFSIASIICIFLFLFSYQLGLSSIPFFIGSELFEVAPRSTAMSLGGLAAWTGNFVVGMAFPSLQNACGAFAFLPFAVSCSLLFLLTKFYLPETRGKDATTVAALMTNGFKSKVCAK